MLIVIKDGTGAEQCCVMKILIVEVLANFFTNVCFDQGELSCHHRGCLVHTYMGRPGVILVDIITGAPHIGHIQTCILEQAKFE
jgi:hypothetical protein